MREFSNLLSLLKNTLKNFIPSFNLIIVTACLRRIHEIKMTKMTNISKPMTFCVVPVNCTTAELLFKT